MGALELVRKTATFGVVVTAVWLAFSLFDFGFRHSADQLREMDFAMSHTPAEVIRYGIEGGIGQGRIGHLFQISLLAFAELAGDVLIYPALCIGLLIAIAWAAFRWVELLAGGRFALALTALYIATLPVGTNHWLPNAYAPQFVPLALALGARILWLQSPGLPLWAKLGLAPVIIVGGFAYEMFLALLVAMTAVDVTVWLATRRRPPAPGLTGNYLAWQAVLLATSLAAYIGFRYLHPSGYDGNQPASLDRWPQAIQTYFGHLLEAPSAKLVIEHLGALPLGPAALATALVVATGLGLVAFRAALPSRRAGAVLIVAGVAVATAATAPVSVIGKYIDWCVGGYCAYIDNRFALIGLVMILAGLLVAILDSRWARVGMVAIVAAGGFLTVLANTAERPELMPLKTAEDTAKRFVCENPVDTADARSTAEALAALPVGFHSAYNRNPDLKVAYWTRYIAHLRSMQPLWLCP